MISSKKIVFTVVALAVGIFGLVGGYKWLTNRQLQSTPATYANAGGTNNSGATPSPANESSSTPAGAPSCFSAAQSWNEIGQNGCVEFTVGSTYVSSSCNAYLDQYSDYSEGFSAWIPDGCSLGETLTSEYSNSTVIVTGTITSYHGAPEIEVTSASQVSMAN